MNRLIRAVMLVYPPAVRERYGAEVTDMLRRSPHPTRDLLDVLRSALADRVMSIRIRPGQLLLLLAPALYTVAWTSAALVAMMLVSFVDRGAGHTAMRVASGVALIPVVLAVVWLARTARHGVPARALPVVFGAGLAAMVAVPIVGEVFGESRPAALASTLTWAVVMLVGKGRPLVALVALELACVVQVLVAPPYGLDATSWQAVLWYPAVVSGTDRLLLPGLVDGLAEPLKVLPVVLTICTAYTLSTPATSASVDYDVRLSAR